MRDAGTGFACFDRPNGRVVEVDFLQTDQTCVVAISVGRTESCDTLVILNFGRGTSSKCDEAYLCEASRAASCWALHSLPRSRQALRLLGRSVVPSPQSSRLAGSAECVNER